MIEKPILCLDFDGVCHSYVSGWTGVDEIRDPPVEGLFEFLYEALQHFAIHIFSSRSHQEGGREAMEKWFRKWFLIWARETGFTGINIVPHLEFSIVKPPAQVTIDDRGVLFMGYFPTIEYLLNFKPWNKKEI
jgi:hypothetical protein